MHIHILVTILQQNAMKILIITCHIVTVRYISLLLTISLLLIISLIEVEPDL